jgi:hypothetical protein
MSWAACCGVAAWVGGAGVASANNVRTILSGGVLVVYGDNANNGIIVQQDAVGYVSVYGFGGTRVNGGTYAMYAPTSLAAVELKMEGGNDDVRLRGLRTSGDFFADLGQGNDRLLTPAPITIGANFTVNGGDGYDDIRLTGSSVGQDIVIEGGTGPLAAQVFGVTGGKGLGIFADDFNDWLMVDSTTVNEDMALETKAGSDTVILRNARGKTLDVNTDAGFDGVEISDVEIAEDVSVNTGKDNDGVWLTRLQIGANLTVSVDDGADRVTGTTVNVAGDASFEGGAGTDVIVDRGIVAGIKKDIKEFETFLP